MTTQEKLTFKYLVKKYPTYIVHDFNKEDVGIYNTYIKTHKSRGIIAINPPFNLNGRTYYNDFALIKPTGERIAIECKARTTSTITPNVLNKEIQIRKDNVLEKTMCFFLEGSYTKRKKDNLATVTDNCKVVYDLNDLVLV